MGDKFPSNDVEALAMFYLEKQNISELSPEELFDKYLEIYERIKSHKPVSKSTLKTYDL